MPLVDEFTLTLIDALIRVIGAFVLAWAAMLLIRSGQWRDPLNTADYNRNTVTLVEVCGSFLLFFLLSMLILQVFPVSREEASIPGTHDWHVAQSVDGLAKLFVSALMIYLLMRRPAFPATTQSRNPFFVTRIAVLATFVILPLAYLQLQTGQILWHWIDPYTQPPVHDVIEAIEQSAWGPWGILHLAVAAIIIAPLSEELFFRGLLLEAIWGYFGRVWIAIVLTGLMFGAIHSSQPQDVIPLVTMGIILGFVRVRFRSLPICILIHALFNARTIAFVLCNPDLARQTG